MVDLKKEIEILIDPEGEVSVSTKGVKGKACLDLVKFLEESLGEVRNKTLKPEYYEPEVHVSRPNQSEYHPR